MEILEKIKRLKSELQGQVVILGHHYQSDDVISISDYIGDSLDLAKRAASETAPYIIFAGVHFMAETADMLTSDSQQVILPNSQAGCSMADMASRKEVVKAWDRIASATNHKVLPITYINCNADLKAFVGEKGGSICTSSNAQSVISWGLNSSDKLFFFPDQHLGRNTCYKLGIPLSKMVVYDPSEPNGGLTNQQIIDAKVVLWYGLCCVHQFFNSEQIKKVKAISPQTKVIVHPECNFETFIAADDAGSTAYIIEQVKKQSTPASFAIGTESNLVNRLAAQYPQHQISSLSPNGSFCRTMNLITANDILISLESIKTGNPINLVKVASETRRFALSALERMFAI